MESTYTLEVLSVSFKSHAKFLFFKLDGPILGEVCDVELALRNVGDTDFPGGALEIEGTCDVNGVFLGKCSGVRVLRGKTRVPPIKRGGCIKTKVTSTPVAYPPGTIQPAILGVEVKVNDGKAVKFQDKWAGLRDDTALPFRAILNKDEAVQHIRNKLLLVVSVITLLLVLINMLLQLFHTG